MRRNISIWMTGIAVVMLASCSQNEELRQTDNPSADEVRLTFSVNVPEMQTRADVPTDAEETTAVRFICEFYEGGGETALTGTPTRIEQDNREFSVLLKKNTDYVLLLWADHGTAADGTEEGNYYDAADLREVSASGGAANKCDEVAFYAGMPITATSTGSIGDITLNRAVAKVCLYETGLIQPGASLSVTYTPAKTFNVATGTTTAVEPSREMTYTLTGGVQTAVPNNGTEIARFYVLAPEKGKAEGLSNLTFTLTEPDGNTTKETTKTINNVPLQANYVTNIRGEFSDYASTSFSVAMNETWNDNQIEIPKNITAADLATSDALKAAIDANGNTGTLKLTGDVSQANIDVVKEVFQSAGYSYVLDMTDANLTDEIPFGAFSFKNTFGLKGIICPKNLKKLTSWKAFAECQAEFITLPAGMTYVGPSQTFRDSPKLKYVNLEDTQVESISNNMFTNCTSLEKIAFPSKINLIETDAFAGCTGLTEMDFSRCTAVPVNREFKNLEIDKITVYVSEDMLQSFIDAWGSRGFKSIEVRK